MLSRPKNKKALHAWKQDIKVRTYVVHVRLSTIFKRRRSAIEGLSFEEHQTLDPVHAHFCACRFVVMPNSIPAGRSVAAFIYPK